MKKFITVVVLVCGLVFAIPAQAKDKNNPMQGIWDTVPQFVAYMEHCEYSPEWNGCWVESYCYAIKKTKNLWCGDVIHIQGRRTRG